MARHPVLLSESEQAIVAAERDGHPDAVVRRKMLVLWSTHCGVSREKTAAVAGVGRATAQRYLAAFAETIKRDLTAMPVRTAAEARDRIEAITGMRRGLTRDANLPGRSGPAMATHSGGAHAREKVAD